MCRFEPTNVFQVNSSVNHCTTQILYEDHYTDTVLTVFSKLMIVSLIIKSLFGWCTEGLRLAGPEFSFKEADKVLQQEQSLHMCCVTKVFGRVA